MKRLALCLALLIGPALSGAAQNADAEFLQIYERIQQGDTRAAANDAAGAYGDYRAALDELERFSRAHPGWNETIIRFRREYLTGKVGDWRERLPKAVAVPSNQAPVKLDPSPARDRDGFDPAMPSTADSLSLDLARERSRAEAAEARVSSAESSLAVAMQKASEATMRMNDMTDRASRLALDLRQVRDRVEVLEASQQSLENHRHRLESERTVLEAKLKEALSPRPAALDPAEQERMRERSLAMAKENEILKASLDRQMTETQRALELAKRSVALEQDLKVARTELAAERRLAEELREERTRLLAKVESSTRKDSESTASLKQEVESLRKELAASRKESRGASRDGSDLAGVRQELEAQRRAAADLKRENADLERELSKLTAIRVTPASLKVSEVPAEDEAAAESLRARRLERERDALRSELEAAVAEIQRRDASGSDVRVASLNSEVQRLEAKVRVLEAKPEPYTPEERALFQAPTQRTQLPVAPPATLAAATPNVIPTAAPPSPSPTVLVAQVERSDAAPSNAPAAGVAPVTNSAAKAAGAEAAGSPRRRTTSDLPAGAGILAAQAQRAFAQRRLSDAEKAYREILALDERNVFTLGNLAAILVEQARLPEADVILKRSLAEDPNDPFSLSLIGIIRFREQKYDEAFEALSRSAQLDPESADTQNYLGITLSQRGQRQAAEAALRKALKLNPGSATAHYNLAVVYATQKPAFLELARYHYEKARRAGQPANTAFEGVLRGEAPPPVLAQPPSGEAPKS